METTGIRSEQHGRVLLLTIDRQAVRNALDLPALNAITHAIRTTQSSDAIGAIVLTGAGRRSFCAGMDLRALMAGTEGIAEALADFEQAFASPERVPILAAVNGNATGGGFELMLKCDMAVAADDVTFGLPEVTRGLVPGGGATLLPGRIPLAVAIELALTGEPQSAQRMAQLGLINRVVPTDEVLPTAIALAQKIAEHAPHSVAAARALMWATYRDGVAKGAAALQEVITERHPERQREMAEGLAAFTEKRRPEWRR